MLNLKAVLKDMGVDAFFSGSQEFEALALAGAKVNKRVCTFIAEERHIGSISESVALVITRKELSDVLEGHNTCIVEDPRTLFFRIHNYLEADPAYRRASTPSTIGEGCSISPLAFVASNNVTVGDNVVIEEFVSVKKNSVIGDNSIIRAGTIVGGEGFEFKNDLDTVFGVRHLGGVVIGENVEIQQNCAVDKAIFPWDDTMVGDNTKTDNMVHIAHAVKLQRGVLIAACTCVAGRVEVEDDAWIGPGVTLINGMKVGENSRVNIGSVATRDVKRGESVTGNFAIEHPRFIENLKRLAGKD